MIGDTFIAAFLIAALVAALKATGVISIAWLGAMVPLWLALLVCAALLASIHGLALFIGAFK